MSDAKVAFDIFSANVTPTPTVNKWDQFAA